MRPRMFEKTVAVIIAIVTAVYAGAVFTGHEPSTTATLVDQVAIITLALLWGFGHE